MIGICFCVPLCAVTTLYVDVKEPASHALSGKTPLPKQPLAEAVVIAQRFLDQQKINMSGEVLEFVEYKTPFILYAPSFWELTWTGHSRIVVCVFQDGLCIMPSASNQSMQPTASPRTAPVSDD